MARHARVWLHSIVAPATVLSLCCSAPAALAQPQVAGKSLAFAQSAPGTLTDRAAEALAEDAGSSPDSDPELWANSAARSTDPDVGIRMDLSRLDATPGSARAVLEIENSSDAPAQDLQLQLLYQPPLSDANALAVSLVANHGEYPQSSGSVSVAGSIAPGQKRSIEVQLTSQASQASAPDRGTSADSAERAATGDATLAIPDLFTPGSHPIAFSLTGSVVAPGHTEPAQQLVAIERTTLRVASEKKEPKDTPAPVPMTFLWPLAAHSTVLGGGTGEAPMRAPLYLRNEELAGELGPGGRLRMLLDTYKRATESEQGAAIKRASCIAIDPDLLDTVEQMSQGYRVSTQRDSPVDQPRRLRDSWGEILGQQEDTWVPGTGSSVAATWLNDLKALVSEGCSVALPYAGADLDALADSGEDWLGHHALSRGPGIIHRVLGVWPVQDVVIPDAGFVTPEALHLLDAAATTGHHADLSDRFEATAKGVDPNTLTDSSAGSGSANGEGGGVPNSGVASTDKPRSADPQSDSLSTSAPAVADSATAPAQPSQGASSSPSTDPPAAQGSADGAHGGSHATVHATVTALVAQSTLTGITRAPVAPAPVASQAPAGQTNPSGALANDRATQRMDVTAAAPRGHQPHSTITALGYSDVLGAALRATGSRPEIAAYTSATNRYELDTDSPVARMANATAAIDELVKSGNDVLAIPPAEWSIDETAAQGFLNAIQDHLASGRATPAPLTDLLNRPVGSAQLSVPAQDTGAHPSHGITEVRDAARALREITLTMLNDPAIALTREAFTRPLYSDLVRSLSSYRMRSRLEFRPAREEQVARRSLVQEAIESLHHAVTLLPPGNVFTRTSDSSPLLIVARNGLPLPVPAKIDYTASGTPAPIALSLPNQAEIIPARGSITVSLTTNVNDAGSTQDTTNVRLWLASPQGREISSPVELRVQNVPGMSGLSIGLLALLLAGIALGGKLVWSRRSGASTALSRYTRQRHVVRLEHVDIDSDAR